MFLQLNLFFYILIHHKWVSLNTLRSKKNDGFITPNVQLPSQSFGNITYAIFPQIQNNAFGAFQNFDDFVFLILFLFQNEDSWGSSWYGFGSLVMHLYNCSLCTYVQPHFCFRAQYRCLFWGTHHWWMALQHGVSLPSELMAAHSADNVRFALG